MSAQNRARSGYAMARKGTMKWNASPWTFLLIVLAKRFILYHVFSPSYIYRGENV